MALSPNASLAGRTVRAHPDLELVALSTLSDAQRSVLLGDRSLRSKRWLLRTNGHGASTLKVVGARTARLLRAARRPSRLGDTAVWRAEPGFDRVIARFVLDGLLEVQGPNGFVGGPSAHALVCPPRPERRAKRAGSLAVEALQYAQSLETTNARELAQRLYDFNRLPETAHWRSRLTGPAAVRDYLGVTGLGEVARLLRRHWLPPATTRHHATWLMWRAPSQAVDDEGYKAYVSPTLEALPDAFAVTVRALASLSAHPEFKVGRQLTGLLRPDKLVIYFPSRPALQLGLRALRVALRGIPAHGVPFAAPADQRGLLFWGVDPSVDSVVADVRGTESWRRWVAVQLAVYLAAAKAQRNATVEPWAFALDRLALDGVDVRRWAMEPATTA